MLPRTPSNETLSTLVTLTTVTLNSNQRESSFIESESLYSSDTLAVEQAVIFCNQVQTFTKRREFPLSTGLLRNELHLHKSMDALKAGSSPILSIQPNRLHFLKKNTPLHTISRYHNGHKVEFCRVYYKILETNLTCYVLMFASGENLVLYNNAIKSHSDTIYKGTKLRLHGASGATSTFGSNSMRVYALNSSSPTLVDFIDDLTFNGTSVKGMNFHAPTGVCPLYDSVVHQNRNVLGHLLSRESPIVSVPIACFVDSGGEKVGGTKVEGVIRIFESTNYSNGSNNTQEASEDYDPLNNDSLILATLISIFAEQEMQKMRGNLK